MKSMYCHGCRGRPTVRLALPKLFLRTNSSTTSASQTTDRTRHFESVGETVLILSYWLCCLLWFVHLRRKEPEGRLELKMER